MDPAEKRERIQKYFTRATRPYVVPLVLCGLLLAAGVVLRQPIVLMLGGLAFIAAVIIHGVKRSDRPDEQEMGRFLDEDLAELGRRAGQRLGLSRDELIEPPIVLGQGLIFAGWPEAGSIPPAHLPPAAMKVGPGGALRLGAFKYQAFWPTAKFIASYTATWDFCEGRFHHESTEEFFYQDVVSVLWRRERRQAGEGEGAESQEFDVFALTLTSGHAVEVVLNCTAIERARPAGEATRLKDTYQKAVRDLRALLRKKK
jgi:hypothetical protein